VTVLTRRQLLQAGGIAAVGLALPRMPGALAQTATTAVGIAADPMGPGYWVLMSDGQVWSRGTAQGSAETFSGRAAAIAPFPTGGGFWRTRRNGRTTGQGTATLQTARIVNRQGRVVGVASTRRGDGLWRVTSQGQIVATGTATNLGAPRTDVPVTGIAAHPEAAGYWVLDRQGRVYAYGASKVLGTPVGPAAVDIAAHPSGGGYWVLQRNGRVTAFGAGAHHGNASLDAPAVGIAAAPDGAGYWVLANDGRVRAFGSAKDGLFTTSPPPTPELTTVGGIVVASDIGRRVRGLLVHAADDGFKLGGYGYRDHARQVQLRAQNCGPRYYDIYVKSSSMCSPPTAVPGRSLHEKGLAIDFHRKLSGGGIGSIAGTKAFDWLKKNAKTYGLYNLPSEPWHWSTKGG